MVFRRVPVALLLAGLFLGTQVTGGGETTSSNGGWEEEARKRGLSETDVAALKKDRILITNEAYRQVFSAYLSGGEPPFITSDSLLNAYHVLYEESIFRLESAMASRLPEILELILKNLEDTDDHLQGKPALVSAAKRRAKLVPGIGLRLMDDSFRFPDKELNVILDQEVKKIVAAKGAGMPKWLGKPDPTFMALDYSRYKPRGFYTRSERLGRYFRAVSWLQSIPFRISKDEELLAILMLGNCVSHDRFDDYAATVEIESFFDAYSSFIGAGDDWDLMAAAYKAQSKLRIDLNSDDLQSKRDRLAKEAKTEGRGALINDLVRLAPKVPNEVGEPHFRFISAYRTPSALLFQRTTDPRRFSRPYPDGLEVATTLGSAYARQSLKNSEQNYLLQTIDSCRGYFGGHSLYLEYLDVIKALLDEAEHDAPDFMKNEAWQVKSCNTVLAGWAQLRHTWALQAKQTVLYTGLTMVPAGFVEPEPEFFSRMANLADATKRLLQESDAFDADYTLVAMNLERLQGIIEGLEDTEMLRNKLSGLTWEERMALELPFMLMTAVPSEEEEWSKAHFREMEKWIDVVVADIRKGQIDKHPRLETILKDYNFDLKALWELFGQISRRLEAIAHKQLRGVELNRNETTFIEDYGSAIAGIMLYGGNSYLTPRDDAPRVVDVYANPQKGGYLHVGVSRPRKLYVLYPWQGKTVLCKGVVMPYYEFVATTKLTDKSWTERLDSEKRPPIPKWMSPVVRNGNLSKAELKDR